MKRLIIKTEAEEMDPKKWVEEYICYAKKNFKNLMEGNINNFENNDSEIANYYYAKVEGDKNLKRVPFFIYMIFQKAVHYKWNFKNLKKLFDGKLDFQKNPVKTVLDILQKIAEDPNLKHYLKDRSYSYQDIRRIIHRYQNNHRIVIKKKILKNLVVGPNKFAAAMFSNTFKDYFDLENEIIKHLKSRGTVILSELRRMLKKKKCYNKLNEGLFNRIIYNLKKERIILIRSPRRRVYLTWLKN